MNLFDAAAFPAESPATDAGAQTSTPAPAAAFQKWEAQTEQQTTTPARNPFDKAILLSVTVCMLGVSRKVSTDAVEVDSDKTLLRVSKKILDCPEYLEITQAVGALKKFLKARAIPGCRFIKGGIYPVPANRVTEIDAAVQEMIAVYNGRVTRFCEVYEARSEEARARLNVLGDAADYPPLDKVKGAFGIETEYVTLGPPSNLKAISREIWQREEQRAKAACVEAAGQVRDAMRTMFADLVGHMTERLTPSDDGKPKKFKESMIANFKEFLETFQDRNITDDEQLAGLVEKARGILAGKKVEALRRDLDTRAIAAQRLGEIKTALDSMVTERPTRAIDLDE